MYPEDDKQWYENSNNIVLLQIPNRLFLREFYNRTSEPKVLFKEPDLDDEPTAMACLEGATSNLPLLLKDYQHSLIKND